MCWVTAVKLWKDTVRCVEARRDKAVMVGHVRVRYVWVRCGLSRSGGLGVARQVSVGYVTVWRSWYGTVRWVTASCGGLGVVWFGVVWSGVDWCGGSGQVRQGPSGSGAARRFRYVGVC